MKNIIEIIKQFCKKSPLLAMFLLGVITGLFLAFIF